MRVTLRDQQRAQEAVASLANLARKLERERDEARREVVGKTAVAGMRECYASFIEFFPWRESTFPTYGEWILSNNDDARIFRQGWAARSRNLRDEKQ